METALDASANVLYGRVKKNMESTILQVHTDREKVPSVGYVNTSPEILQDVNDVRTLNSR